MNQDQRLLEVALHAVGIGDEVRRQIAAVELHTFDHVQLRLDALAFFDGDDPVFADLLHGLGNDLADGHVVVGRDRGDL